MDSTKIDANYLNQLLNRVQNQDKASFLQEFKDLGVDLTLQSKLSGINLDTPEGKATVYMLADASKLGASLQANNNLQNDIDIFLGKKTQIDSSSVFSRNLHNTDYSFEKVYDVVDSFSKTGQLDDKQMDDALWQLPPIFDTIKKEEGVKKNAMKPSRESEPLNNTTATKNSDPSPINLLLQLSEKKAWEQEQFMGVESFSSFKTFSMQNDYQKARLGQASELMNNAENVSKNETIAFFNSKFGIDLMSTPQIKGRFEKITNSSDRVSKAQIATLLTFADIKFEDNKAIFDGKITNENLEKSALSDASDNEIRGVLHKFQEREISL